MQDGHFYMFRSMCRQYDICIFKRSKLRVERTTKCFARILEFWASNGIVLIHNGLRRIIVKVCNLRNRKKAPFDGKRATLDLPNDSFCQSIVVV